MKLILIKMPLEYNELLTLGKTYDGDLESTITDPHTFEQTSYYIIKCNDSMIHISADHFITLEEWRNKQLTEILNND